MNNSAKNRTWRFVKSLKLRVFAVITLIIIVPTILGSIFIFNMASDGYLNKKIDKYKSSNTMLKNSIISEGYLENGDSAVVDTQIAQLSKQYNCRIEIVDSRYNIVKDTDSSEVGKTSVSEFVIRAMTGENVYEIGRAHV